MAKTNELFSRVASKSTRFAGSHWAFLGASATIAVWLGFGPHYHWDDSYQIIANTFTTLVTYIMVFLIQNTQNREGRVLQLKLDAILRALENADHKLMGSEDLSEAELEEIAERYKKIAKEIKESDLSAR